MSLPKFPIAVVLLLLLSSLLMVAVSSVVDPSQPADTSDGAPPQRIGHLHLEGGGSDKTTLAVQRDNLRIPRFADQAGAWHACADDLSPSAQMSCHDDDVPGGHTRLDLKGLRVGQGSAVDELVKLARAAATEMDLSMIIGNPEMEPGDVWKIMSCAVLISAQNGGTWDSKEAHQLRSMGFFSKEDVLKQLGVIGQPNDCSEPITFGREEL